MLSNSIKYQNIILEISKSLITVCDKTFLNFTVVLTMIILLVRLFKNNNMDMIGGTAM